MVGIVGKGLENVRKKGNLVQVCTNFKEFGGIWESVGEFTKFHARLLYCFAGKVEFKSAISSIMHNHVTTLGVPHPDKVACKVLLLPIFQQPDIPNCPRLM